MVLRAGEVLQEVAVALRRDDAKVEAQPVVRDDGRLRRALRRDVDHPRQRAELVDQRARVGGGRDDVEVAHRLAHPRAPTRRARPRPRRDAPQLRDDRPQRGQRAPSSARRGPAAAAAAARAPPTIFSSVPGPMPAWPRSCPASAAAFSAVDGRDAELLPDAPRGLRPEPREPHEHRDLLRAPRPCAWSARGSRRPRRPRRSCPRSSCRSPAAPGLSLERELRHGAPASRGSAPRPCR